MADIRIFISSPSDVREERKILESVINNDLQQTLGKQHGLTLKPILWETNARPMMGNIQENIFEQLGDYDIFVGIFWKRFGTPTGEHDSGSEAEFRDAYKRWEANTSRPILMYFCEREASISLDTDPALAMEQLQQAQKVNAFRKELEEKGLIWPYRELEDFRDLTRNHLFNAIDALVKKSALTTGTPNSVPKTPQPPAPTPPEARRRYLKAFRRDCLQIPLTVFGDHDGFDKRAVTLDQVFISLNVTQKEADPYRTQRQIAKTETQEDAKPVSALMVLKDASQVVLLGDPGSGKSSFVKHLLADLAESEEKQTAPLLSDARGLLPVMILLRDLAPVLDKSDLPAAPQDKRRFLANKVVDLAIAHAHALQAVDFTEGIRQAFVNERVFLVLDGLDEVPYYLRSLVREAVGAVLNEFNLPRVLVTCRIRSYSGETVFEKVPTYTLAPLNEEQVDQFIENWYAAQGALQRVPMSEVTPRTHDLQQAAKSGQLQQLASNPMLLTTMTIIHQQETELPKDKVKLYDLAVDLLLKRWQQGRTGISNELASFIEQKEARLRPVMEKLAYEAHRDDTKDEAADLPRTQTILLLADDAYLGNESLATQFLDYVDKHAGLLVGKGGSPDKPATYSFPHRTFQEYLAGCHIIGERGAADTLRTLARFGDYWGDSVVLGIEELVINRRGKNELLNLATLISKDAGSSERDQRLVLWAARIAELVGKEEVERDKGELEPGKILLNRLQQQCVGLLTGELPPVERVQAGRTLARLGDPRKELLTLEAMPFCHVPAGPFIMGERKEEHELELDYPYWISKYPVTQMQFAAFVDAGGYEDDQWWTAAGWKEQQEVEKRIGPLQYKNPVFQLPNHPVVGVMWYEAYAFTRWLTAESHKHGWIPADCVIRLPNEPEWEKAARGGLHIPNQPKPTSLAQLKQLPELETRPNKMPKRRYPWGEDITTEHCSFDETGIGTTSSPGCFSKGIGPYGLHDQGGNVWEWQRNKREAPYPYPMQEKEWDEAEGTDARVLRGGAFYSVDSNVRCAVRDGFNPSGRDYGIGFRVVSLPLHRTS